MLKNLYLRVSLFSLVIFGLFYWYTSYLGIPGGLNKSVADTSIFIMGLSMMLSGLTYFFNVFDSYMRYRKHLGLVGFAFAIVHVVLSFSALQNLFQAETWQKGAMWPAFTGLLALIIFTVMALVSNSKMARLLGAKWWRFILRTGYLAVILVWMHVVLLKSARWMSWYEGGMKTLPSLSLLVSIFMLLVIVLRIILFFAVRKKVS